MIDRKIPQFQNESEEANWWFEHRAEIGSDLITASRQGRLGEGSVARRARKMRENSPHSVRNDFVRILAELGPTPKNNQFMFTVPRSGDANLIKYVIRPTSGSINAIVKIRRKRLLVCA
jgi:hypothetical protein